MNYKKTKSKNSILPDEIKYMIIVIAGLLLFGFLAGYVYVIWGAKMFFALVIFLVAGIFIGWALKTAREKA